MSEKSVKHVALISLFAVALRVGAGTVFTRDQETDWGLYSQHLLDAHAEQLFGVEPVEENALGPYSGLNSALSVIAGKGLKVSVVSNATHRLNDMIALWPNDDHPTHLFIAIETGRTTVPGDATSPTNISLQVVDLSGSPNSNARTVLLGLTSGDPIRRTPWGTILVGEEATDGGVYEIFDPLNVGVSGPVKITNRATGAN